MKRRAKPKFDFLLEILNVYRDQALKCKKVRAYLAGCVFLGSALEAGLLAMTKTSSSQVRRSQKYLNRPKKDRNVDEWGLFDLLELARELRWIPSELPMGKVARASGISAKKALANGDLGYFADVVREIRNLVHPGVYVREMKNVKITKSYYEFCYEITAHVFDFLRQKLEASIRMSHAFRTWAAGNKTKTQTR
jgi:hypothetical protein